MTTNEEQARVIESWQQSGLSLQKYAAQVGIAYGTLQYWRKRYHRMQHQRQSTSAGFVALNASVDQRPPTPSATGIVIVLPSGVRIEVH